MQLLQHQRSAFAEVQASVSVQDLTLVILSWLYIFQLPNQQESKISFRPLVRDWGEEGLSSKIWTLGSQ